MTSPVDLDKLDAALKRLKPQWTKERGEQNHDPDESAYAYVDFKGVEIMSNQHYYNYAPPEEQADAIALLVNTAQAMSAELRLAREVIEAARPLGAAMFLDVKVQDEARFQIRRTIDAYDALTKPEAPNAD